jgi:DNA-binding YbaB/EbfC family protein
MKNLAGLMKQATEMQEKMREMQERLEALEIAGESGAGLVKVTLSGKGELKRVVIDPKLAEPADIEMLQDLIVAAHAEARRHLDATTAAEMQKVSGGLNLPPGFKLPF